MANITYLSTLPAPIIFPIIFSLSLIPEDGKRQFQSRFAACIQSFINDIESGTLNIHFVNILPLK